MRDGGEYFLNPETARHRQYEALRAYLVDELPAAEAADRFGYSTLSLNSLCRDFKAGQIQFFEEIKPGPRSAPKREAARDRVITLRKQNYSVYDIQKILRSEDLSLSHVVITQILQEEGFARLPRRADDERPPVLRPDTADVADIRQFNPDLFSGFETEGGGLFVFLPTIINWGLHTWVRQAGLPGSQMIPALQSILSILALKLTGTERLSHVMDVCDDPGFALFSGLNALPKTTALSTYSYRVTREMTLSLLSSYVKTLKKNEMIRGQSFNLDFHSIPQRGEKAVLEKHYVSKRSRAERAVLVFLVQDVDTRVLCYSNASVRKEDQSEEILRFADYWKKTYGKLPPHLVFDSQLTTYEVLDDLDEQGIQFVTLRRRYPALLKNLRELPKGAWKAMTLHGASRRFRHVHFTETTVTLKKVKQPLRQLAVKGLGHDEPTIFVTNDQKTKSSDLVDRYARRMIIENGIADNVGFFHMDALTSSVALQVDLDVMLTLIANALFRQLAARLPGFEAVEPKTLFRSFLNMPARVTVNEHEVRVQLRRCAHHPILLSSGALDQQVAVPWWGNRTLRLEIR